MKKLHQTVWAAFLVIALAMGMSAGARTDLRETESVVRVDISDLDLATAKGRQAAHARLKRAAWQVCGSGEPRTAGSLDFAMKNRDCFEEALTNALERFDILYDLAVAGARAGGSAAGKARGKFFETR